MKMKNIIIAISLLFTSVLVNAQNTISFSFSAEHICTYIELDSIKIENITQGRDTILYNPDTVLNIIWYDIDNLFGKTYNKIKIAQNFPNPFTEKTRFNVLIPLEDDISIKVYDISGRLVAMYEDYFEPGIHEFDFYASHTNYYVLHVNSRTDSDQIKMIGLDTDTRTNTRIEYVDNSKIVVSKYFLFEPGDDMRFTGYTTITNEAGQDTIIDIPLNDMDYLFTYENLVPEKPSQIIGLTDICEETPNAIFSVEEVEGVTYTWIIPEDWEIVLGQGYNAINVNIGQESGIVYVVPSNTCGSGEPQMLPVNVSKRTIPQFIQLGPYCQGEPADVLPLVSINGVWGIWNDTISTENPGYITYSFSASNACAMTASMEILVDEDIIPIFDQLGPFCKAHIPDDLPIVSINGVAGTWDSYITTYVPDTLEFTFTAANACQHQVSMEIIVIDDIMPEFDQLGPYCVGALADVLPDTSTNLIPGTWDQQINTETEGVFTYTFIADNVCQTIATMEVEVDPQVIPTFNQLGPYCINDTPEVLPEYSTNGIWGTWDSEISTSEPGTTEYTFTAGNSCLSTGTMSITVLDDIIPTFDQLGPYCVNEIPDELPTASTNGITGTWNAEISTYLPGTFTYTFTALNVCATQTTMVVTIEESIIPTFDQLGPYCVGEVADIFPTTSLNGIDGTWNEEISTATPGYTSYMFTSDNVCATEANMIIYVQEDIIQTFDQLGPYCQGDIPALLPVISNQGNTGTWNSEIATDVLGVFTYTFTADNTCQSTGTMDVEIIEDIIPTFTQLGPYCVNTIPDELPTISDNGIVGTWNTYITTYSPGLITYTFTASNACYSQNTMDITVVDNLTPTFTQLGPYCVGDTPDELPLVSLNGISGTWDAAIDTDNPGQIVYTFTADNICATQATMLITVIEEVIPTFNPYGPYCFGDFASPLPSFSNNGVWGSWDAEIDTEVYGVSTYTFTANNACLSEAQINVTVTPIPASPTEDVVTADIYEIEWTWNLVPGATGYRYNTVNDINTSFDNLGSLNYTQTGLECVQDYDLYVWAYNDCEVSAPVLISASTIDYSPYAIGDIGPAGGIIFYDKGACTDGWRYLESSPEDIEISPAVFSTQWGCEGTFICGTSVAIGTGLNNTQIISSACLDPVYAAQQAALYEYNGFDDWFLPSRDELNQMYLNLKLNGWGNFSSGVYWSSTEDLASNAWAQIFADGATLGMQVSVTKSTTRFVRAIRKF